VSILLTPEVIILMIEDVLLLVFNTIAALIAFRIQKSFDLNDSSEKQYTLEKQTYLASYIIKFSLYLKILSILFFIFTLDKLSTIIPGAMCAVGVTSASGYGLYLLLLKIVNIFLYGFWLLINEYDINRENYPFTRIKFKLFIFIYVFFLIELLVQNLYFFDINPQELVSCCGTVFNAANTSVFGQLSQVPNQILVPIFYVVFILLIITTIRKKIILRLYFLITKI